MSRVRLWVPFFILCLIGIVLLAALYFRSTTPQVLVQSPVKVLGEATPVKLLAVNRNGVRRLSAAIEQGGKSFPVYQREFPSLRWSLFRKPAAPAVAEFTAGKQSASGVADGKATLRLDAVSNDLAGRSVTLRLPVEIISKPPGVTADEDEIVATLGGAGAIAFTTSGYVTESGVRVGKYRFRSWPMPGGPGPDRRIAFFALPHDLPEGEVPLVYATNPSGMEAISRIRHNITRKQFRRREILLDDAFLNKVFQELDLGGKGVEVARFVKINKDMRQLNNQQLADLRLKTAGRMLWNGPFQQLTNSQVEAQYCDYRTYFYKGQSIDEQVHLGFDLATTARAPVTASNDGVVIFAGRLGIYGNAVVIDHGWGLQSLYAHLSEFSVKAGDSVKKRQSIGRSGTTGLAGGDHLHFTILLEGVPVNPVEWWDEHWLRDRVFSRLKKQ
ncbi:MAG: M23 family metallopeptidase [Bryobacterales bacterium]|nr:M23 family metallopeptidase [Bryobacterales bacterium]